MKLEYPDELIRGISHESYIDEEGRPLASMFQFDDAGRSDGFLETSINWYDDEHALRLTLEQRKRNDASEYQFKVGVAILSRRQLDSTIHSPNAKGAIDYERQMIEGNPYHGNILLKSNLEKQIRNMMSAAIALMCVERIEYRHQIEKEAIP